MALKPFQFKQFSICQDAATHKVGTDAVLLGAWLNIRYTDMSLLDIGTGTGIIALMLAQRTSPLAVIDAVEVAAIDARQAKQNVEHSPWPNKVAVHHTAIQEFYPAKTYDLIVTNPPYFLNSLLPPDQKRGRVRHTEQLSFDDLLQCASRLLSRSGRMALILPPAESRQFLKIARDCQLFPIRQTAFRARTNKPVERLLLELAYEGLCDAENEVILYEEDNNWSTAYRDLTSAFYLNS